MFFVPLSRHIVGAACVALHSYLYNFLMRGRVTAVSVLLSLLFLPAAVPQCSFTRSYGAQFRSSVLDLAVDGNDLWAATAYGVSLFDRSTDPPALVSSIALPGITRTLAVNGSTIYAGSGTSIFAVQKEGRSLKIAGSVDTGGNVNDLEYTGLYLYAATTAGLQQYDASIPATLARTTVLPTSQPIVTSVSSAGQYLYAADSDASVEVFNISIGSLPQRIGAIDTLPLTTAVHATTTRIYTTDGTSTDVFFGSGASLTKATRLSIGSTSFAIVSGDIAFAAGTDRRIYALDLTTAAAPVQLFATDIIPTGGTINRAASMQVAGGRLYVAAGDAGLLTWNISTFNSPYPLRSYGGSAVSTVVWAGTKLYAGRTAGGISEFTRGSGANLTAARQWDSRVHEVLDGAPDVLLTASGSTLYYWALTATPPFLTSSTAFRTTIDSAVLAGTTAWVILADHSVWHVDLSQQTPVPQSTPITATSIARNAGATDNAFATALVRDDGTTVVQYFPTGDPAAPASAAAVAGAATSSIALSGTTAAVFTYRGITLVDVAAGTATEIPQSGGVIARGLAFSGTKLLELTDNSLLVWDVATRKLARSFSLPVEGTTLSVSSAAAIATPAGVTAVAFDAASAQPSYTGSSVTNSYYRKAVAASDRLYLFDGRTIDIFSTTFGVAPRFMASVAPSGVVDFTANTKGLFALVQLVGSTAVARYTRDGVLLAQKTLDEGSNVQPISITTAAETPWVSFSSGCLAGTCEKKTAILDPVSLVRATLLDGAAADIAVNGTRASAIFDLPAEVRAYDLRDPLHPALLASRAAEGSQTPVSIAASGSSVYVLGEKLYTYDADGLAKVAEQFDSFQAYPSEGLTYVDQQVFAEGACVVVTGRTRFPLMPATGTQSQLPVPSAVRALTSSQGKLYLLTDHSLEVLTTGAAPVSPRRRGTR